MEPIKRPRAQFAEQDLPEEERESSFENCAINTLLHTLQAFCSCCLRRLAGCRTKPLPRCEKQTKCKKSHHRSSCFFWTRKLCWRTRAPYNDYIFAARISSPFSSSFFWQLFVALVVEAVVINKEKPQKLHKYSSLQQSSLLRCPLNLLRIWFLWKPDPRSDSGWGHFTKALSCGSTWFVHTDFSRCKKFNLQFSL